MIFNFIEFRYFIIAFAIGMLFVYTLSPTPDIIIRYPTPENAGKIIYKDDAGVCYKYRAEEVPCTPNAKETALQHTETKNE